MRMSRKDAERLAANSAKHSKTTTSPTSKDAEGKRGSTATTRAWDVGLICIYCGQRVTHKKNGSFVQPVNPDGTLGAPWARHGECHRR